MPEKLQVCIDLPRSTFNILLLSFFFKSCFWVQCKWVQKNFLSQSQSPSPNLLRHPLEFLPFSLHILVLSPHQAVLALCLPLSTSYAEKNMKERGVQTEQGLVKENTELIHDFKDHGPGSRTQWQRTRSASVRACVPTVVTPEKVCEQTELWFCHTRSLCSATVLSLLPFHLPSMLPFSSPCSSPHPLPGVY